MAYTFKQSMDARGNAPQYFCNTQASALYHPTARGKEQTCFYHYGLWMQLKPDGSTEEINGGRTCGRSEPVGGTSRDEDSIAAGVRGHVCRNLRDDPTPVKD